MMSVNNVTTSNTCCVDVNTDCVVTRPAALANDVNVFNTLPSVDSLVAGGLKFGCSRMGAGHGDTCNDTNDTHP